jgi:hypothetical protein
LPARNPGTIIDDQVRGSAQDGMATLKEFEEALRAEGMNLALAILDKLRERDRANRTIRPARRVVGRKMTPELAQAILELHGTTDMTQQEIAFKLGINQGRVNEVVKRGKWLSGDPNSEEAQSRDKAMARMERQHQARRQDPRPARAKTTAKAAASAGAAPAGSARRAASSEKKPARPRKAEPPAQLAFGDLLARG